jgi:hypothetical protein
MPSYPGNALATLLRNNQQAYFWNNETVSVGTLSVAFELERINRSFYPWGVSIEAIFSGAPGAFEIDLYGANNDKLTNYNFIGNITVVNAYNVGRYDMASNVWPKYVAGYLKSLANAVNLTLQVTK